LADSNPLAGQPLVDVTIPSNQPQPKATTLEKRTAESAATNNANWGKPVLLDRPIADAIANNN